MKSWSVRKLVLSGILAALVFVVTAFTKIPSPFVRGAYYHAGDSVIYLSALVLGPSVAAVVSGLGSFVSDLYLGFPLYMFATLIIKGIMGGIAGYFLYSPQGTVSWSRKFLGILIAGLWMAVGYYIFEVFIIRIIDWRANIPNLFANIAQAFVGAVIFLPLSKPLERLKDI
jgi:uncharacterized membrane protein